MPTENTSKRGALTGIRVIEVADEQAEYCGLTLAGLGADVIKVEPPGGNSTRRIGPFYQDQDGPERSLFFWQYNRGKRSIVLDLRQRDDRERFRSLVATADILLESTPRGELDAAGLGIQGLMKEFPTLIVARTSPFGDDGPWVGFKGSDLIHLALGGVMMNCGYDPAPGGTYDLPPIAPQMWHAYHVAGEQLSVAIIAALLYRWRTGKGQYLEVSLLEAALAYTVWESSSYFATGEVPGPLGSAHRLSAPYQALRTSDGFINIGAPNQSNRRGRPLAGRHTLAAVGSPSPRARHIVSLSRGQALTP